MRRFFDRQGTEIPESEWATFKASRAYCIVGRARSSGGLFVSTVWLGYAHVRFETKVFALGEANGLICGRYWSEGDALVGHRAWRARFAAVEECAP